jgi:alkylhydroperoxidase/carboxymuconolactone decarboxylase family protein YurZ
VASENDGLTEERRAELKAEFERRRGFWAPVWDHVLDADPEYFKAYLEFSSVPWENGVLEPKVRELIYIAVDAAVTHMHPIGTRQHIRNALRHGATKEEIMEVLELISVLGFHSVGMGLPILQEELEKAGGEDA